MSIQVFKSIRDALGNLNPEEIHKHTERPLRLFLYADTERQYREMEAFFIPRDLSEARRLQVRHLVYRATEGFAPSSGEDLEIYYDESAPREPGAGNVFAFSPARPDFTIRDVLARRPDLAIPLGLNILPFRAEVSNRMIKKVAKENALFALATAVPDIVPFISLPWAVGEFASDTAVLTANQIRMAFVLAAANDRAVGYGEQKTEIASIIAGAFGWRALARELVGKIPWGAGMVPKAAIAFAGTYVVGLSLERYYRLGRRYTRAERHLAYQDALERGRKFVATFMDGVRQRT